jgi:uncharacterized YigZ family protein
VPNVPNRPNPAYAVPEGESRFEHEVKKSRFIGVALHVASEERAATALEALRLEFPDATHHCWAYVLGNPQTSVRVRADDDGEPSGTAGRPILNVVQHKNVGDILVVVVRYFGGVKLGAGGLVRAYTATASGVMARLALSMRTPLSEARLRIDYADERPIRRVLEELEVTVVAAAYGAQVELTIRFPEAITDSLATAIATQTSGRVKL